MTAGHTQLQGGQWKLQKSGFFGKSSCKLEKKNVLLADSDQQASWRLGLGKELNILVLTACKQEIDNSGISRLLPKSNVPKPYIIFCSLFHPVRGEGVVEIAKMGQLPKENQDCFVREYSARLGNN